MTTANLLAPVYTAGSYIVARDEDDSFFYVTDTRTGERVSGAYTRAKTANRRARQLDEAEAPAMETPAPEAEDQAPVGEPNYDEMASAEYTALIGADAARQCAEEHLKAMAALVDEALAEHDATPRFGTREEWLVAAAELIRPLLGKLADLTLPAYRVTCGWPSSGGKGNKKRTLGECWHASASADNHAEIFISPMEADRRTVLAILAHELIHACLPAGTAHKKPFCDAAATLGFKAPFTQLCPTDDLWAWADEVSLALGAYPHAALGKTQAKAEGQPKEQKNRYLKATCTCDDCEYTVRIVRKWVVEVGAPICPKHKEPMDVEGIDLGGDDEGEGEEG